MGAAERSAVLAALDEARAGFDRAGFDAETLAAATRAWAVRAQHEHASVASFARWSLGLLAVAAPPELLEAAHEAGLDEIVHARLAFAIASAYGGAPVGPGPLAMDDALEGSASLAALVVSTVAEGCVGETLSAIEAREAEGATTEPLARIVMRAIADDEARHAELAWTFVRWALGADARARALAEDAFARALAVADRVEGAAEQAPDLAAHGILGRELRSAIRRRAVRDVLRPAARALFADASQIG